MGHPTRSVALGSALVIAVLAFVIYQGISNNLVYYITPSELLARGAAADGASLRLGGQVRPGSVHFDTRSQDLRFILQDPKGSVKVESHGIPPELFRPGIGVVVEGTYSGTHFAATNLMIKHGNSYRAPKPGQTPVSDSYVNSASP